MNANKQYTGYGIQVFDTEQGKQFFLAYNGHRKEKIKPENVPAVLAFISEENAKRENRKKARTIAAANKNRDIVSFFTTKEGCIPSVSRLTLRECRALYGEYYLYCVRKGKKACNASKRKKTQAIYSNRSHYMANIRTLFHDRHNKPENVSRIVSMIGKVREYNAILSRL